MPPYFLQTKRLGFRPWTEADVELAMALWGDPEVTLFIGGPFDREWVLGRLATEIARPAYWGFGYAPEAAQAVMRYAFHTLGARALFAGHGPANEASRRVLAKLGFRHTHDEFYLPTGLNHPSYLLTVEEFFLLHPA